MAFVTAAAAALPTILTIGATALGVVSTLAAADSQRQASNYQAMIADRQAKINEENAVRAQIASQQQQQENDNRTRALLGEQIAAQSASGLRLGGRSQMLTRKAAREIGRLDSLNIRHAGELEAYNWRVGAEDAAQSAAFARSTANNAMLEGFLGAAGVGLSGLSKINWSNTGFGTSPKSLIGGSKGVSPRKLRWA